MKSKGLQEYAEKSKDIQLQSQINDKLKMKSRARPLRGFSYIRFIIFPYTYPCIYGIMREMILLCMESGRNRKRTWRKSE